MGTTYRACTGGKDIKAYAQNKWVINRLASYPRSIALGPPRILQLGRQQTEQRPSAHIAESWLDDDYEIDENVYAIAEQYDETDDKVRDPLNQTREIKQPSAHQRRAVTERNHAAEHIHSGMDPYHKMEGNDPRKSGDAPIPIPNQKQNGSERNLEHLEKVHLSC